MEQSTRGERKLAVELKSKRITILLNREVVGLLNQYNSYIPPDANLNLTKVINDQLSGYLQARLNEFEQQS